ncbi:MAG: magnesium transporter, partial [Clostridia bacterium]|nr:magnesium transporter [Clostridia bacterium]
ELPANVVDRILRYIPKEKRKHINEILSYPVDSAGSIMTVEYIDLRPEMTVEQALDKIRVVGLDKETIYNCYVTESRQLRGVVSARQLLTSDRSVVLSDIMECNVISVFTEEDKETAVQRLSKYDLDALPVVDRESRLVGIVTFDDAIEIIQEEATEDMEKMAAIVPSEKPYLRTGVFSAYSKRVPWLLFLMLSATFTGKILGFFEEALSTELALTMFIPMLMDTGGNAGGQASMMIMRGLSLGEITPRDYIRIVWKEIRIAVLCGLTLAAATFLKVLFIDGLSMGIAATVCLTLAAAVVLAKFIGASLPMLAKAIKFDPAVMASPLITTIVDAISLIVYFNIAKAILHL